jgi:hypothetical protein
MNRLPLLALALGLSAAVAPAADKPPPKLTWDTFDEVKGRTLPTAKELGWQDIPWRSDLGRAVAEAAKKDVPVLVWAMNGDPLGCT